MGADSFQFWIRLPKPVGLHEVGVGGVFYTRNIKV